MALHTESSPNGLHLFHATRLGSIAHMERDQADLLGTSIDEEQDSGLGRPNVLRRPGGCCCHLFWRLMVWLRALRTTFGLPFLFAIATVYFVQGFKSFSELAVGYLLKDDLKLQPTTSQALATTMAIPWTIKPLYGILSDSLPLCGYRRCSYLLLCSAMACGAYITLSIPLLTSGAASATLCLLLTSLSVAFSDVVIDAKMVEMSRLDPANGANDLQSISWIMLAIGGILGSLLSGPMTDSLGPRPVFLFAAVGPLVIMVLALSMKERRQPARAQDAVCLRSAKQQTLLLVRSLRLPVVWKSALWIFLSGSISPTFGQVTFYYATDFLHFSPEFMGAVGAVGYLFLMVGTVVYNCFFKHIPFRHIFFGAQLALALTSMFDLLIVSRVNLKIGISDKAFVLGDEILSDVIGRLKTMPMLVLSAKLCPVGLEGTLFALLMSISNLAGGLASYWGAAVCSLVGIGRDHYDNLWMAVVIRSVLVVVPVFFLFLIPKTDPQAEIASFNAKQGDEEHSDLSELDVGPSYEAQGTSPLVKRSSGDDFVPDPRPTAVTEGEATPSGLLHPLE
eukprot:GGOE01014116.1.p1 GENE.GGOE01014116.1~~GGOE01014116.1.p1  ORF type:complete len:564 (-),score=142.75 GGOE01014116.1:255-1946(-)